MKVLFRLLKRKSNVRRMLAAAFLFIAFVEMGSHAMIDSQDPNALTEAMACSLAVNMPAKADCPEQRRQRQETKNLLDEMTTHMVVLNSLVVPHSGITYRSLDNYAIAAPPLSRTLAPPFHPPKQA
ncbi:MAG TPA: hypothetical protein VL501_05495 [Pyrinomonadaceae bacterium]|nr:hypothetical protein [Pyrinomonadaceae bacterium]